MYMGKLRLPNSNTYESNIMNNFHHHGSIGNYYSFVNKGWYRIHNKSSIDCYTNKKNENEKSHAIIHQSAANIHKLCVVELNNVTDHIGNILTSIQYIITPIINTINTLQSTIGDYNLLAGNRTSNRCWNIFLSANGMTEELQTENDCGYTVITVPQQKLIRVSIDSPNPMFIFKFEQISEIGITHG